MARHAALTERVKERLGVRLLAPARALDRMADALAGEGAFAALAEMSWSRLRRAAGDREGAEIRSGARSVERGFG